MPAGKAFRVPETVEAWQEAAVWDTMPPIIRNGNLYLLKGAITVLRGVDIGSLSSREYVLDIAYPDGMSSSATLTLKCMSPAPHRKRERCLDEIVRGCVDNTPAQGQVGVYRT